MSLKIKDINEHSKPIKLKKDLILNTNIFNSIPLLISPKNNNKKITIKKTVLKSLIKDRILTNRNNIKLENKQNNLLELNKKIIFNDKNNNSLNNTKLNIKSYKKKGNINININNINNCCNEQDILNPLFHNYNYFTSINYNDIHKPKKFNNYNSYSSNPKLALNNIKKRCRKKLYCYNYNIKKYHIKIINDIITEQNKHIVSIFKNNLIWNDPNEYLKRYYLLNECEYRLNPIALYYNLYTYCFPNYYCNLEIIKILLKNVKRKIKNLKIKEIVDNKVKNEKNQNNSNSNSISDYFEEDFYYKNNNEKEFFPLIDSDDINNQSQSSFINKKSLSLSSIIKYNDENPENNLGNVIKKRISFPNENIKKTNIFNVNITPIRNKTNKNYFNDVNMNYNNINNDEKNKKIEINKNKQNLKLPKVEDNELIHNENKSEKKSEKIIFSNNNNNKKLKINSLKIKHEQSNFDIKNKNINPYFKTDYNDVYSVNSEKKKDFLTKKYIGIKRYKNKELNNNIINQKTVFNSVLNIIKNSSKFNQNKINLKKILINKEVKNKNIIRNYYTQRAKFINKTNNTYNKYNKNNSYIQSKNKNVNNKKNKKVSFDIKNNNIIRNLNYNYFNISKYSRLLTSNDRKNNFSSKKNIEFPFGFHSLSINKNSLLKISNSSKVKVISNIYTNKSNNSSSSNPKKQTTKKINKKHKKGKSDIISLKKRNIVILNVKAQKFMKIKKNKIINKNRKIRQLSLKDKKYFKNVIDTFKNTSNYHFYKDNCRNNTFQNNNKNNNMKKLMKNTIKRKCKSNSPNIIINNNYFKKSIKRTNVFNRLYVVSKKIIKNNDNNYENNYTLNNDNNYKQKKLIKTNNNNIKSNISITSSIFNNNVNMNLNTQRVTNKNNNKNNNNINIIYSKNKLNLKRNIKSYRLEHLKNKKKIYNINKNIEKTKLEKNSLNRKININKTNDNIFYHKKRFSIQLKNEKKYNKKKDNFNNSKLLVKKNKAFKSFKNTKNQFKNYYSINKNKEVSENLTERKINKKKINISIINDSQNSFTKDIKNNKNCYTMANQNKNINSLKNKILLCKKKINKVQNKPNTEDRSYKKRITNNCGHKKMVTNITSLYDNPLKRHIIDILKGNINKYYYRNSNNKGLNLKKYCKSNYNK